MFQQSSQSSMWAIQPLSTNIHPDKTRKITLRILGHWIANMALTSYESLWVANRSFSGRILALCEPPCGHAAWVKLGQKRLGSL